MSKKRLKPPQAPLDQARALMLKLSEVDATDDKMVAQLTQEILTLLDAPREWATAERLKRVKALRDQGLSLSQVAVVLNVSKSRAQQLVDLTKRTDESLPAEHAPFRKAGAPPRAAKSA